MLSRWSGPFDVQRLLVEAATAVARSAAAVARVRGVGYEPRVDPRRLWRAVTVVERRAAASGRPAMNGWSQFFECADGWVRLHGQYPHHARVIRRVLDVADPDEVAAVLKNESAFDVESALVAAGGVAGAVRTPGQWASSVPGVAVRRSPVMELVTSGRAVPLPPTTHLPLTGIRVVDMTRVVAGPVATACLAALGAQVVRVDPPNLVEDPVLDAALNVGKTRCVCDVTTDAGQGTVLDLVRRAHVVVLGYRPGALARWGLGAAALQQETPGLVVGSVSAWGETGPWADRRGFDSIAQAVTGVAAECGVALHRGQRPGVLPVRALDHAAGLHVAAGVMVGLARRGTHGSGRVAVSLARMAQELRRRPGGGLSGSRADRDVRLHRMGEPVWELPLM